ncbi:MAG: hypothetical protein KGJ84_17770 [Elusimicrobia bacterium]|nr:hypothetical protein [Elusimicrobiota bacterium]
MKKILEVVVVVAALILGVFVLRQWRARADAGGGTSLAGPGSRPGSDEEGIQPAASRPPRAGAVAGLPMIKLASPPRAPKRDWAVPPPAPVKP